MSTHSITNIPERLLYSIEETGSLLSLSRATILRMTFKGTLEAKKIGKRRLITKASIDKLIRRSVG